MSRSAGAGSRRLVQNAALNLGGQLLSLAIAAVAITILARELDTDRFGFLLLAWALVGYFSLFDFGLSRAVTWAVSDALGSGQNERVPGVVWPATFVAIGLGVVLAVVLALAAPSIAGPVLGLPEGLRSEGTAAIRILGASLPMVIGGLSLRGVLEAHQRFDVAVAIRVPAVALTYLGSAATVVWISHDLVAIAVVLLIGRAVVWVATLTGCLLVAPELRVLRREPMQRLRQLLGFGGWVALVNALAAVPVLIDRILIAALGSISSVAFYATPQEATTRLLIAPGSIVQVLFPALTASIARDERVAGMYGQTSRAICVALAVVALPGVAAANDVLDLWLGPEYAAESTTVLQLLLIGAFIAGAAYAPNAAVQATGKPRLSAMVFALSVTCSLVALSIVIPAYGIEGAAAVTVGRTALELACLVLALRSFVPLKHVAARSQMGTAAGACALAVTALLPDPLAYAAAVVGVVGFIYWGRGVIGQIGRSLRPSPGRVAQAR